MLPGELENHEDPLQPAQILEGKGKKKMERRDLPQERG
jgi:hypothetical protein